MSEVGLSYKRRQREDDDEDEISKFLRLEESKEVNDKDDIYVPLKQRKQQNNEKTNIVQQVEKSDSVNTFIQNETKSIDEVVPQRTQSLLLEAADLKKSQSYMDSKLLKQQAQLSYEMMLLKEANQVQTNALQSNEEIASGVKYDKRLTTTWNPPQYIINQGIEGHNIIRNKWNIIVEGNDCPPPIKTFKEMKFPKCILDAMTKKNILRPTPIQVQGIPALLSGRDMVGIAFTGSGKTLTFSLPLIMFSLEEEINMPLVGGEGPIGIILCPSRELARQTYEVINYYLEALENDRISNYPIIRSILCIGGENSKNQIQSLRTNGIHIIVATPGRLNDLLDQKIINLSLCKYFALDEADRMLDLGFDEVVHSIINHFTTKQRQTILFSATMPKKFQDFAKKTLIDSLIVNVGRAGAANLDVIQEVEYVKSESKIIYLLECLQKTPPPVIIFSEHKNVVDEIHEYLLIKGIEAVSIHGSKDQNERNEAILLYKQGKKDVLVATGMSFV